MVKCGALVKMALNGKMGKTRRNGQNGISVRYTYKQLKIVKGKNVEHQ